MTEFQRNQELAERIAQALGTDGQTFLPGQCVALLNGKVVAVADDLEGALRVLRSIEPDAARGMVFEIGPPLVDVIR